MSEVTLRSREITVALVVRFARDSEVPRVREKAPSLRSPQSPKSPQEASASWYVYISIFERLTETELWLTRLSKDLSCAK